MTRLVHDWYMQLAQEIIADLLASIVQDSPEGKEELAASDNNLKL